jgi:hypothetical protein
MPSFSCLIVLIWVFSLLCFVMLAKGLLILLIFSKNQLFVSLILCIVCLVLISLISALIFAISYHLLVLGLVCFCFSRSLWCIIRWFIWEVSVFFFNIGTYSYNVFSLLCPTDSGRWYFYFHWILGISWILPLWNWSPISFLAVCCSVSMCFSIFWGSFCYWGLVLFSCDLIWCRGLLWFSWIC